MHDLNSDHDRRHLDGGLPSHLEFKVQRRSGDVRLTLVENKRLNLNAPVFDVKHESKGKRTLIKKKTLPLEASFSINILQKTLTLRETTSDEILTYLNSKVKISTIVHVCPAKIQISLRIRAVLSESSLDAFWLVKDTMFFHADNEASDQTALMLMLI